MTQEQLRDIFIARGECGCIIAAMFDDRSPDVDGHVADWFRRGLRVELSALSGCTIGHVCDTTTAAQRPALKLIDLPDDMAEAFESFRLAIMHHRLADWREVSLQMTLAAINRLTGVATESAAQ